MLMQMNRRLWLNPEDVIRVEIYHHSISGCHNVHLELKNGKAYTIFSGDEKEAQEKAEGTVRGISMCLDD